MAGLFPGQFSKTRAQLRCQIGFDGLDFPEAEFSSVKAFKGSRWEDSNGWDAKCIPQPLLDYLLEADSHRVTEETKSKLVATCH